ncbi:SDR family NAD(P)-dependent oxidoreductase [Sphingomonas sp. SRS2]|uniref:SDR family NAD(P)-dependent oxidoreductase n=1 Tax=Sphingomonas sp. SRS2 TaxID=133190 RepID=UPI00061848C8|nr:SDR family oxidoreductase [Sphingomonas sp. SRS2]KKC27010.1 oxidoreductase [Sphingomonas sp. SRS2]
MLDNLSILVTGAGGGIGSATALVLAGHGARLILTDVNAEAGEAATEAVKSAGGEAYFVPADLGSEEQIAGLVKATVDRFGRIDGAFNNAAVEQSNKPLDEISNEEWDRVIRINLSAVFLGMRYQARAMLAQGGGSIVNTASSLAQVGLAGASDYCAAKHGVLGLTRAGGADYGTRGIRVNAILPGITRTPMIKRLSEDPDLSSVFDRLRLRHSMGRFGEPHEIGESVAWLLSPQASFVNGAAIAVDGGYLSI